MAYELKPLSDHVRVEAFTHAALTKGSVYNLGGVILTLVDINAEANDVLNLDTGKQGAVFEYAAAEIADAPAIGAAAYLNAAGKITATTHVGEYSDDTYVANTLVGVVVANTGALQVYRV
ncbi:hypothetical protein NO1_0587 [Candidatus Termititenax aidoneus]|uniref:Uncharacterized protein n=1 Tax=Termititenax aidoneus TaxID=2218524 RepID=A0A388T954_TERA1|nr:hypothetical protein NO1_0587 [Candidatus Termititenax aidoneus]